MIIYKVTNKINNKSYIGQTIYTLERRKINHISKSNGNSNLAIHCAIRKYGKKNFEWKVIDDSATTIGELNLLEVKYIKEYHTFGYGGYNMSVGGLNCKPSIETKSKIRSGVKRTQEKTGRINQYTIAKDNGEIYTESVETRKRKSESHMGSKNNMYGKCGKLHPSYGKPGKADYSKISEKLKGRKFTDNTKKLMSDAWANRKYIKCPHCVIESKSMSNMKRWHFDNCKNKVI